MPGDSRGEQEITGKTGIIKCASVFFKNRPVNSRGEKEIKGKI